MNDITHIGLILDGNRRYAQKQQKPLIWGHEQGAEVFFKILEHIYTHTNITTVTAYILSLENMNREETQVSQLLDLFSRLASEFEKRQESYTNRKAKVRFVGKLSIFSDSIKAKIDEIEAKTAKYTGGVVNLCFGYSGQDEIVRAAQKVVQSGSELTIDSLTNSLDIPHSPDLIIRTGGHTRMSNFLVWQSTYTEWFFVKELWPEFSVAQLESIIAEYSLITRNNGK